MSLSQVMSYYNAGDLEQAGRACALVLSHAPADREANHLLGVICFRKGMLSEARALLERALVVGSGTPKLYNNFGAVLQALGDHNAGADAFREALSLDPAYPWAFNNLGCVYRDTNRPDAAIEAFHPAVELKPSFNGVTKMSPTGAV